MKNNILENLELKLAQTRLEQKEQVESAEKKFSDEYQAFFEYIFEKDTLGFKRGVTAYFILDSVDGKSQNEALQSALQKTLQMIPLESGKKEQLLQGLTSLEKNKNFIEKNFSLESRIQKDPNYPLLADLVEKGAISGADLAEVSLRYKNGDNIIEATHFLDASKREIISRNFYELNNTKTEERIKNFETDFHEELSASPQIQKFPRVVQFLGRYYTRLKVKNTVESKAERLKRMFKIAFLKLYRYKFSGIDIDGIMEKIDSYSDFEDMISLLLDYFEVLRENPDQAEVYSLLDEIDTVDKLVNEAEGNKDKEIQLDKTILETSQVVESIEEGLAKKDVENLLSEDTRLVGDEFVTDAGKLAEDAFEEEEDEEELMTKSELERAFESLRDSLFELEEQKRKCFAEGNYDEIDTINDELLALGKKAEKLKKLLGIGIDDEYKN